jgi:hypothetical protein
MEHVELALADLVGQDAVVPAPDPADGRQAGELLGRWQGLVGAVVAEREPVEPRLRVGPAAAGMLEVLLLVGLADGAELRAPVQWVTPIGVRHVPEPSLQRRSQPAVLHQA